MYKTPRSIFPLILFAFAISSSNVLSAEKLPQWADNDILAGTSSYGLQIRISSELDPLAINQIHSWLVYLEDSSGNRISNAEVIIIGGMPEHDHGLPTAPQITSELEPGTYLLEGVRFHMQGKWQLDLKIQWQDKGSERTDSAVIDFIL